MSGSSGILMDHDLSKLCATSSLEWKDEFFSTDAAVVCGGDDGSENMICSNCPVQILKIQFLVVQTVQ